MQFKDCQKDYPVFILDRNELNAQQGKIIDVSRPHFDPRNPSATQMVIDVTFEVDGKQQPPFVMPENAPVAYTDKFIISTDRETIIREVQAILSRNEQELSMVDQRKETVSKCKHILEDFNPELRERRKTEDRITKIEGCIDDLRSALATSDSKTDQILRLLQNK